MNRQECDILKAIKKETYINQRILSRISGYSLGAVNKSLRTLCIEGYLADNMCLTQKTHELFEKKAPKRAVILAAGYGMRMVPINTEVPKGLIEVNGEPLIERLIKQLHDVGIYEIRIVVGFMKEHYEYLIDSYNVELIVNEDYSYKNNLHSLYLVKDFIDNAYIVPCDIWCNYNPFSSKELYSWYMVSDLVDNDSSVRVNRKMELVKVPSEAGGNAMIGISYLLAEDAEYVRDNLEVKSKDVRYDGAFWEEALVDGNRMIVMAKVTSSLDVIEINTYEQLRELDSNSNQLKSDAIEVISSALNAYPADIIDISVLKKGMTNRSFLFSCKNKKYIMRIPGEGTDLLINRSQEAAVYNVIGSKQICDDIAYINPENGYKITEYLSESRACNPECEEDLQKCMIKLRWFHELGLMVEHEFDIFKQIEFYEFLWKGEKSVYRDYLKTKANVQSLKYFVEEHCHTKVLAHIDAVPDNFLFVTNIKGEEEIRLIDWEYAGMQDPHVDIAMFCIYSLYDREHVDHLIDLYFVEGCSNITRIKIYCYIAACGLLWSNWCEYKRQLGVEFGEYSLRQYRYAKEYYRILCDELEKIGENLK